jgi:hypothetical protein
VTRPGWLGLSLVAATLLVSCGTNADAATTAALTSRLCTLNDLGGGYLHQTEGDFFPEDLAALPEAPADRRQALRSAGLVRGRLTFWKATVDKPPFAPPVSVYCQVMQFATEAQAGAFAASLEPARGDLETAGLTFLPSGRLQIDEPPAQDGSRVFTIRAADDWNVAAAIRSDGPFVVSVYAGGRGVAPAPERAMAVMRNVEAHASAD